MCCFIDEVSFLEGFVIDYVKCYLEDGNLLCGYLVFNVFELMLYFESYDDCFLFVYILIIFFILGMYSICNCVSYEFILF